MNNQKYSELCGRIAELCEDPEYEYRKVKNELIQLFQELERESINEIGDLLEVIDLHRRLCKIKNRKASYIENEIGRRILVDLPFSIRMDDEAIPEGEVEKLQDKYDSDERIALKLSSELLKYGKELMSSKEDKSKRYKNRIKEGIRMLNELQQFYEIEGIKEMFKSRITDKDKDLQFFALYGLEIYYEHENVAELKKEEEEELERIINSTKSRETASTCCQILINSGKIDEFAAMIRIDDWKDRNWSSN